MKYRLRELLFLLILLLSAGEIFSQAELVPANHPVYNFLKRMQIKSVILNYNSVNLPLDRKTVQGYLSRIDFAKNSLSDVDKKILSEYLSEFTPDRPGSDSLHYGFLNSPSIAGILDNDRVKHLYKYNDENVNFYVDGQASISYRNFNINDSERSLILGELGMRFRGTLFNNVGFSLRLSNGQQIAGGDYDRLEAMARDPKLSSNVKFKNEKYYDSFEGYLRYATENNWFALTLGRESLNYGYGYIDKMFLTGNAVPFDFLKLDLNYKSISYSFYYGNVKGDSLGRAVESKNIVSNNLSFNFERFNFSVFETIIIADRSLSFTYLNPVSFLISADFSSQNDNDNNAILGFNFEIIPFNNLALQGTLLIDDLDFRTLFGEESLRDNRFGFQTGLLWNEFLTIPNLTFAGEYTRINPYVYTHRTNKVNYTHWNWPLGHHLQPNSDEIALKLDYNISQRFRLSALFSAVRGADGYVINNRNEMIHNYGGDILRGDGDLLFLPEFLKGNRYNTNTLTFNLYFEPVRQFYLMFQFSREMRDLIYLNKSVNNNIIYLTAGVDF